MRLGIDVGGTNTDAVLMNGSSVLASHKGLTTADVCQGIISATQAVLQKAQRSSAEIHSVMIGTTQFTNALVARENLNKVGILRLASPSGLAFPAMTAWPEDLQAAVASEVFYLAGGYEFNGGEISPLDESGIRQAARELRNKGINSIAVIGTFSSMDASMEQRTAEIIRDEMPEANITLSHHIGRVGLLERENATILNAALSSLAQQVISSFKKSFEQLQIHCPIFISQNDGTLISTAEAAQFPVLTIGSGPTNSMRGAAYLTGLSDAVIIDVGGTTSDIGVLKNGFPRESTIAADIGGVRTNFRMPDTLSIALGGGTEISLPPERFQADNISAEEFAIGPASVGYQLVERAYAFGGDTLTATDVAAACGSIDFAREDCSTLLSPSVRNCVLQQFKKMLEVAVDRMKTSASDTPVIVVGGGGFLVPEQLAGAAQVLRPAHAEVANAVGAAIAQVGAQVEQVFSYEQSTRNDTLQVLKQRVNSLLVAQGGDKNSIQFTDIEETFLNYLPGRSARLRIKAVADLNFDGTPPQGTENKSNHYVA